MDGRQQLFYTLLAGGGTFGLLGALFGAVVGAVTWRSGRAAGTGLGLAVARAYARAAGGELSPTVTGLIAGAADGFVFLGGVGLLLGGVAAAYGHAPRELIHPAGTSAAALALGAVGFGALAYGMLHAGPRVAAAVFAGGVLGALVGAGLRGADGLLPGALAGIVAATLLARAV